MKKSTPAPQSDNATKPITPVMQAYADWLKAETGYQVDVRSVQLAGTMRVAFQKSEGNRVRLAQAAEQAAAATAAKAQRKAARAVTTPRVATPAKPRTTRGSTIATAEGVVLAETRHVEVKPATTRRQRPAVSVTTAPVEAVSK